MAVLRRRPQHQTAPNANLGRRPTKQQKLQHVTNNLGIPGISKMQGSSVNIVDTVNLVTNATGRTTLNFFTQSTNKSRNFSNFQQGILTSGESLLFEFICFIVLELSASDLTDDATNIVATHPISYVPTAVVANLNIFTMGLMNIQIANSGVVKDYQLIEADPNYNPKTTGIAQTAAAGLGQQIGQNAIALEAPPVLPPNQKCIVSLEIPPTGTVAANTAVMCIVGKFGSIFSAKQNL